MSKVLRASEKKEKIGNALAHAIAIEICVYIYRESTRKKERNKRKDLD